MKIEKLKLNGGDVSDVLRNFLHKSICRKTHT